MYEDISIGPPSGGTKRSRNSIGPSRYNTTEQHTTEPSAFDGEGHSTLLNSAKKSKDLFKDKGYINFINSKSYTTRRTPEEFN